VYTAASAIVLLIALRSVKFGPDIEDVVPSEK
jgi:hypothetical protein